MENNIFQLGCLVQFETHRWGGVKKIDKKTAVEALGTDWAKAQKNLVDPESLKPIKKKVNEARTYLSAVSLPFPIKGLVFIPKDLIGAVDAKLTGIKNDFDLLVDSFCVDYANLREAAKYYLNGHFSELDYPVDIGQRFGMSWRFVNMDVPNGDAGVLSPALYEREKVKFVQTMEEARIMAIEALRAEFQAIVGRMVERLEPGADGKPKTFRNTLVSNFYDFFETFKSRNIFDDDALTEVVTMAQETLNGVTTDDLRTEEDFRGYIHKEMKKVDGALQEAVVKKPARKLKM